MQEFEIMDKALQLAEKGLEVYPLTPNSKVPTKGNSYKTATNNQGTLLQWFGVEPQPNLGLRLDTSDLLVVDIDLHSEDKNGKNSLLKLADDKKVLPPDTYIEKTPNGGLHYFYRYTGQRVRKIDLVPGIDVISDFCVIAPSEINGKPYAPMDGKTLADVQQAPNWLIQMIQPKQNIQYQKIPTNKKWFGRLLDEIVQGTEQGSRNDWLTQITGKLFWTGADAESIYPWVLLINQNFLDVPLDDHEVNTIFSSILKRDSEVSV